MTGAEIASQVSANKENLHNQQQLLHQQQNYATEAAATANQTSAEQYLNLYSPQAKVEQLDKAGLSVGLMYGQGGASGTGTTAAQAATPAAQTPLINPAIQAGQSNNIMNILKTITEAQKTKEETKNEEKKGREIEANIEQILQNTKKLEEETKTNIVSRNYTTVQTKLAEKELEFQTATLDTRIDIIDGELGMMRENLQNVREQIRGAEIDNRYKGQMYESTIQLNGELAEKYVKEQTLIVAQEALARAQEELTKAQKETEEQRKIQIEKDISRLQYILDEYEQWGYKATEANNWATEVVALVKLLLQHLTGNSKGSKDEYNPIDNAVNEKNRANMGYGHGFEPNTMY